MEKLLREILVAAIRSTGKLQYLPSAYEISYEARLAMGTQENLVEAGGLSYLILRSPPL